jgi:hypothetical protein
VAEGAGPEFKPQYRKKQNKNKAQHILPAVSPWKLCNSIKLENLSVSSCSLLHGED